MSSTQILGVIATVSGLTTASSWCLQARRMLRTRSSQDVSIAWVSLILINVALWLAYSAALGVVPLVIANGYALIVAMPVLVIAVVLRAAKR
jgi:uncharacterized protein with PQ loop repeat